MTDGRHATGPDVRVCADARDLSERAAAATVETIADSGHAPRSLLARSLGWRHPEGALPRCSPRHIAIKSRGRRSTLFWGDERFVPADDPASNYRMARELLLDRVPLPASNIHPMPTQSASPDTAARDYERTLRAEAGNHQPPFDLVLLGLGADGHTASLFPRSSALNETTRWVVAVTAPVEPVTRLTLTLPAIAVGGSHLRARLGSQQGERARARLEPCHGPKHLSRRRPALGGPSRHLVGRSDRARAITALTVAITCSGVKPNSRITTGPGAEAPNRSTPTLAPSRPT